MWKSLLDSLVEAFAMCDPVAYMHYIEWKRAASSGRIGLGQDHEDVASRPRNNPWPDSRRHDQHQVPGTAGVPND